MENEKIKEMLLQIHESNLDFSVVQSGKESKRVNGLYKPDTHEIILHNKNFKTDEQLVYTAVHEYTHHIIAEEQLALYGSEYLYNAKMHTQAFWARFQELLAIAEEKGFYKIDISSSPELEDLTKKIRTEYLEQNGKLMSEFGRLLIRAHALCEQANIRYEDYIDRILCLPRNTARDLKRVGSGPDMGVCGRGDCAHSARGHAELRAQNAGAQPLFAPVGHSARAARPHCRRLRTTRYCTVDNAQTAQAHARRCSPLPQLLDSDAQTLRRGG